MKEATAVLSAMMLVVMSLIRLHSLHVRVQNLSCSYSMNFVLHLLHLFVSAYVHVAKPPRIITHPQKLKDVIPGKSAKFTVQATGTEPLNYNWQWKRDEKGSGSKQWQPCEEGWSDGAILTIPSVQKPNEGSYRCVVSNRDGNQISKAAQLSVGK